MALYTWKDWWLDVTEQGAVTEGSGTNGAVDEPKNGSIIFTMPMELKTKIEEAAKADNKPVGAYVRSRIADLFGYELPATQHGRARKYATVEERIAAQKAKQQERNELIKKLLAEYRTQKAGTEATSA